MGLPSADTSSPMRLERLQLAITGIAEFLERHGIQKSHEISDANRKIFLSWPEEKLAQLTNHTERILDVHLQAERKKDFDFEDSGQLLRLALQSIGLSIDDAFYDLIDRNDIVEVYDLSHIQIFRSFNFFELCNYNLDDVLSHEWYDLYERSESVNNEILNYVAEHLTSSGAFTRVNIEPHLLRERFSEPRSSFMFRFKYLASIFSGPGTRQAFVSTSAVSPIDADSSRIEFFGRKS